MQLSTWNPFKFIRQTVKPQNAGNGDKVKKQQKTQEVEQPLAARTVPAGPAFMRSLFGPSMLDAFFKDDLWPSLPSAPESWFGDFSPSVFRPSIDVVDEGKNLRISAEIPGMEVKDVKITFEDGSLTIHGEKRLESKTETDECYRVERSYGAFSRVIPLPSDVEGDKVSAKMDKGVLTIVVPKSGKPSANVREVPING